MAGAVFAVVGKRAGDVLEDVRGLLAAARVPAALADDGTLRLQGPDGRPAGRVAMVADGLGTLVELRGTVDPSLQDHLVAQLQGVVAAPPLGPRARLDEPAPSVAAGRADPAPSPAAAPAPAPPKAPAPGTVLLARGTPVLRLDDGGELVIDRPLVLGRDPVRPASDHEDAVLVEVMDERLTVSKTHLSLRPLGSSVVVQDLGSTNGTEVGAPGGPLEVCRPHRSVRLVPGGRLRFGAFEGVLEVR